MVEERKADVDSKGSCESLTGGLKLKINLRDRQTVRKRHRSSSSASTDSSISANQEKQPKRSLDRTAIKRSRKERVTVNTDDSGFHDNSVSTKLDDDSSGTINSTSPSLPPSLPPSRKSILNEYDLISVDSLPRKKIPEPKSSNGNSNGPIKSEALKKSSARSSMTRSEILLVDMNGSCPSPKRNGLSDAAATPQSTEQAHSKNSTEKVKEAAASRPSTPTVTNGQSRPQSPKIEPAAVQLVKRLSRDVINHYNTITKPNQE